MTRGQMFSKVENLLKSELGFGSLLQKVKLLTCEDGRCTAEFVVDESMINNNGSLHGGCTALINDNFTTYALVTHPHSTNRGMSIEMHTSYLEPAPLGSKVKIEANTIQLGKTIAFIELYLKNEKGDLIAKGSHRKFVENPKRSNVTVLPVKHSEMSNKGPVFRTAEAIALMRNDIGFGRHVESINILSCANGSLHAEFTVTKDMGNNWGTLHGGFTSLITENFTSYAMMSHPISPWRGLSLDLHNRYFRAAPVGSVVVIVANTIRAGKKIVFADLILKDKKSNEIVANGSHTVYVGHHNKKSDSK